MHDWKLIDILEEWKSETNMDGLLGTEPQFNGNLYLLRCDDCGKTRVVLEVTFEKMLSMGVASIV